jgi:hypothetical protein
MSLNSRESKERNPRCIGGGGIYIHSLLVQYSKCQRFSGLPVANALSTSPPSREPPILYAMETGIIHETGDRIE